MNRGDWPSSREYPWRSSRHRRRPPESRPEAWSAISPPGQPRMTLRAPAATWRRSARPYRVRPQGEADMPWGLTPAHLIILLVIVLIVVGPGKLPDTGAAIGKALRGFKDAMEGDGDKAAVAQQPAPPTQAPLQPLD
ncbi:MAG: twin-arginine translocase TatA/TatE family subunit, partial [Candidatus Limnocylindrales bacterium]